MRNIQTQEYFMKEKTPPDIREKWQEPNYNEEQIAPYTLEDPLTFLNGKKVAKK